jgi:spore coat polysaccharide biosynthesis protein SpsF
MVVTAIIQARMGSTRLPGKILKEVDGKTLLDYQMERVKASKKIDQIVIATTINCEDDIIEQFCLKNDIKYYRGPEIDVLTRYYEAASKFGGETIIRLTSDCPIIDPVVIDETISYYMNNNGIFDYVTNTLVSAYPRGYDVEVFSKEVLEKAYKMASSQSDREHVTAYIYKNADVFNIGHYGEDSFYSNYRLTVDTEEDFQLVSTIISNLYHENHLFNLYEIRDLFNNHPELSLMNSHVRQKKVY